MSVSKYEDHGHREAPDDPCEDMEWRAEKYQKIEQTINSKDCYGYPEKSYDHPVIVQNRSYAIGNYSDHDYREEGNPYLK